jgi:Niemann-Pick C2 protein
MLRAKLLIFVFAILSPGVLSNIAGPEGEWRTVKYHNCKSEFTIKEVRVSPCESPDGVRCPLKKGTSPKVSVTFVPNREVKNLTATVHGIVSTIPTEFPLPNRNGCSNSNLTCPLVPGQEYTYTQSVPILSAYPNLQVLVRWALDDKSQAEPEGEEPKNDVCFIIRANVVD